MPGAARLSIPRGRGPLVVLGTVLALLLATSLAGSTGGALALPVPSTSTAPFAGNATTYPVNFTVVGLAAGTPWNLTVLGQVFSTTGPSILFQEPNGTYPYSAYSVGFPGNHFANGSFAVAGHAVNVPLTVSSGGPGGLPNGTAATAGTPGSGDSLLFALGLVLVVGVIAALAVAVRGKPLAYPASAVETPLGAPGAERSSEPGTSNSPDDPLGHML